MPLILPLTSSSSSSVTTTQANDIISATSQDVRQVLGTSGSDGTILLDYVNRISLQILRQSNWQFLLSAPQRFMTRKGVTDYWLGATGTNPAGSYDTALNLTNFRTIKPNTVFDRSNYVIEGQTPDSPLSIGFQHPDLAATVGPPKTFKNSFDNPFVLSLYPAPDNQNIYQPSPEPPFCTTTSGGALAGRTYYVKTTLVDNNGGESAASASETKVFIPANSLVVVQSPQIIVTQASSGISYSGYKVYASATSNGEVLQNGGASINIGTSWTEPNTGLVSGTAAAPSASTIEPLGGYLIEFRYFAKHVPVVTGTQVLQIPDDYKDIVIAGVNWLAYKYLKKYDEANDWRGIYQTGLKDLIRAKNQFPDPTSDFIRPDLAGVIRGLPFSFPF